MMLRIDIAARIPWVYDHNRDCVMVSEGFDSIKIHLPAFLRDEIVLSNLNVSKRSTKFINREPWPWYQNVSLGSSKNLKCDIYGLCASRRDKNIFRGQLVGKILRQILGNRSDISYHCVQQRYHQQE